MRLPGAVWAGLLVAGAGLIHTYVDNPMIYDVALVVVTALLKYLTLSSETTIGELLPPGAQSSPTNYGGRRPGKWQRFLLG